MAVELQFNKNDETPWGFRLTGGADFGVPLTVVKVTKDSLAEEAGMQLGDVVVRIENYCTADLTHGEAHDIILAAGKHFNLAVRRGTLEELEQLAKEKITNNELCENKYNANLESDGQFLGENLQGTEEIVNGLSYSASEEAENAPQQYPEECSEERPKKTTGGGSKNLKDVLPKVGDKKWSTFLVKPTRPKPKRKSKEGDVPKEPPYRVKIIKGKPKTDKKSSSAVEVRTAEAKPETPIKEQESKGQQLRQQDAKYEQLEQHEQQDEQQDRPENGEDGRSKMEERVCFCEDISSQQDREECRRCESATAEDTTENEEHVRYYDTEESDFQPQVEEPRELSVEEQLAQVQQQLLALSQLPAAIQSTLDAVTQQLAKLVPVRVNHSQTKEDEDTYDPTTTTTTVTSDAADESEEERHEDNLDTVPEESEAHDEEDGDSEIVNRRRRNEYEGDDEEVTEISETCNLSKDTEPVDPDAGLTPEEREEKRLEEERIKKQQKELLAKQEEAHQRRLDQRPTRSLQVSGWIERPIILPGGRKWSGPGDTAPRMKAQKMSDDYIAETISSQSEIIVGQTLGVNFLKYQPPPKNMDYLKKSEVYRLVHDMDAPPTYGVAARPEKIPADQDCYSQTRSTESLSSQLAP